MVGPMRLELTRLKIIRPSNVRVYQFRQDPVGGYGGNRTPVLTKNHSNFYMFISFSLVHTLLGNKQANNDYLLNLVNCAKELTKYNPQYLVS